jgi:hypothetical protein
VRQQVIDAQKTEVCRSAFKSRPEPSAKFDKQIINLRRFGVKHWDTTELFNIFIC